MRTALLAFLLTHFFAFAAYAQKSKQLVAPEAGASPPTYKVDQNVTRELDANLYKDLYTVKKGKSEKNSVAAIPDGPQRRKCRLVVYFKKNISWAEDLDAGSLELRGQRQETDLTRFDLRVITWFDVDKKRDGLVLSPKNEDLDLLEAATEISRWQGVSVVYLKMPK